MTVITVSTWKWTWTEILPLNQERLRQSPWAASAGLHHDSSFLSSLIPNSHSWMSALVDYGADLCQWYVLHELCCHLGYHNNAKHALFQTQHVLKDYCDSYIFVLTILMLTLWVLLYVSRWEVVLVTLTWKWGALAVWPKSFLKPNQMLLMWKPNGDWNNQ